MLVERDCYLEKIRPFYDLNVAKVLMGSRRAETSKTLELIIEELKSKGVKGKDILSVNFEDLSFEEIDDYHKLNDYVLAHKGKGKQYLFFDEIQHVSHFEKAIDSFRVAFDCSIFITGSNSKLLSSEISTLLTGRVVQFTIYPFSYFESELFRKQNKIEMENSFSNYLEMGGYPLRFSLPDGASVKNYLNQLYEDIRAKDIFARDSKIEKEKFNRIAKYIAFCCLWGETRNLCVSEILGLYCDSSVNRFPSSIHEKAGRKFTDMDEQNNRGISLRLLLSALEGRDFSEMKNFYKKSFGG